MIFEPVINKENTNITNNDNDSNSKNAWNKTFYRTPYIFYAL